MSNGHATSAPRPSMTSIERALLSAIVLLTKIKSGERVSELDYQVRLAELREVFIRDALPEIIHDPYYGKFFR